MEHPPPPPFNPARKRGDPHSPPPANAHPRLRLKINAPEFNASIPPGLPTWFIARSHRYTEPEIHWRRGGLFRDREHHARLTTDVDNRAIELTVHGPQPHNFFALLRDGFEGTTKRFPGLDFKRLVPCPAPGCPNHFPLHHLELWVRKQISVQLCPECGETFTPHSLLLGIRPGQFDEILIQLQKVQGQNHEIQTQNRGMLELMQREFTSFYEAEQSRLDHQCPSVFTLGYDRRSFGERLEQSYPAELTLYCECPGHWHPVTTYRLQAPAQLLQKTARLAQKVKPLLQFVAPTVKSKLDLLEHFEERGTVVDLAKEGVNLSETYTDRITEEIEAIGGEQGEPEPVTGARLGALRALLEIADSTHPGRWGGLELIRTKQFHYLWVCSQHRTELIPPPPVPPPNTRK